MPLHNDTIFMDVYVTHLKASSGGSNETRRNQEITVLRNHLNTNSTLRNSIFGADLNVYFSNEPAYQTITSTGSYPMVDPINAPGNWHNGPSFAYIHTQCTRTGQLGGDGAGGGMDDRFDQILVSSNLMNGANHLQYLPGTYTALGQDGNHYNGGLLDAPANTSGVPQNILNALYYMSDHLPVVMDVVVSTPPVLPVAMNLELNPVGEGALLELFPEENQSDFRFGLERKATQSAEIRDIKQWSGEAGKYNYSHLDLPGAGEWQYRAWSLDENGVRTQTDWKVFLMGSEFEVQTCEAGSRDLCLLARVAQTTPAKLELLDTRGRLLYSESLQLEKDSSFLRKTDWFPGPGVHLIRLTELNSGRVKVLKAISW